MEVSKKCERAARDFFNLLNQGEQWDGPGWTVPTIKLLILSAFHLYEKGYGGPAQWDIRKWKWPAAELESDTPAFAGDEPWTILLRRAVELSKDAAASNRLPTTSPEPRP